MLVALLLSLSISLNVITAAAIYRVWLWVKISANIGHPFALFGSTRGLENALRLVTRKR